MNIDSPQLLSKQNSVFTPDSNREVEHVYDTPVKREDGEDCTRKRLFVDHDLLTMPLSVKKIRASAEQTFFLKKMSFALFFSKQSHSL